MWSHPLGPPEELPMGPRKARLGGADATGHSHCGLRWSSLWGHGRLYWVARTSLWGHETLDWAARTHVVTAIGPFCRALYRATNMMDPRTRKGIKTCAAWS
eukprot:6163449-Pyramimonas_sp.AAC.1